MKSQHYFGIPGRDREGFETVLSPSEFGFDVRNTVDANNTSV